jgi:hypothetical protein
MAKDTPKLNWKFYGTRSESRRAMIVRAELITRILTNERMCKVLDKGFLQFVRNVASYGENRWPRDGMIKDLTIESSLPWAWLIAEAVDIFIELEGRIPESYKREYKLEHEDVELSETICVDELENLIAIDDVREETRIRWADWLFDRWVLKHSISEISRTYSVKLDREKADRATVRRGIKSAKSYLDRFAIATNS